MEHGDEVSRVANSGIRWMCELAKLSELPRSDNFAPVTHSVETNTTFWTILVMQ